MIVCVHAQYTRTYAQQGQQAQGKIGLGACARGKDVCVRDGQLVGREVERV